MVETIVNNPPGILFLGGSGSRLSPLTDTLNKHLLPVYNKPMVLHSINFLQESGIRKVVVITNPQDVDAYSKLLESNKQCQIELFYVVQDSPRGTAHGLKLAGKFITEDSFFSLWGDNVFEFNLKSSVSKQIEGKCRLHLTRVDNPQDFGVVEINKQGQIMSIIDKPQKPKSKIVCTGFMGFSSEVFEMIEKVQPNKRGEYDIMDAVRMTHDESLLEYAFIKGYWLDAAVSFETLLVASILVKEKGINKPEIC